MTDDRDNPPRSHRGFHTAVAIAALLILAGGVYLNSAASLGTSLIESYFFAAVFGLFLFVPGYPVALLVGGLLRTTVRAWTKVQARRDAVLLNAPAILLGLVLAGVGLHGFWLEHQPSFYFESRMNGAAVPASIKNFHVWRRQLPGDDLFAMRFDLSPADFNSLLGNGFFVRETEPFEIDHNIDTFLAKPWLGCDIAVPKALYTEQYVHHDSSGSDGPSANRCIMTDVNHMKVIVFGDN
jgi:hypothetical protein